MSNSTIYGFHLPSTLRSLRHRNFRLFFAGQAVSLIGTWMQMIALNWLVYRLTGSVTMLATINLVAALPLAPVALWGGSLADRFPKRSILLVSYTVMMVVAFLQAVLAWTDLIDVWQVLVLAGIMGAAAAVNMPVQQSFITEMVEGKEDLSNAIGLNSMINNTTRAIGPALAGIAIATVGEAGAFLINSLTFVAIIISLLLMRLPVSPRPVHQPKLSSHLREAAQYLRGNKTMIVLLSLVAVTAFLSRPYVVLLPVFAEEVLRDSAKPFLELVCTGSRALFNCQSPNALIYGLLVAAMGLGAVGGSFFVASLPDGARRGRLLTLASINFPALLLIMSLSQSFVFNLFLLLGIGFSFVSISVLANTLIQITVPDRLRGRIMSFYSIALLGMMRVGGIQAGIIGDLFGVQIAVGIGALVCLIFSLYVVWRYPKLRRMV